MRAKSIQWARALVLLQLLWLAFVGAQVVIETPVFGPIDERGHYAYVQFVAEQGRLPRLNDYIGLEVSSLARGIYPERSDKVPELMGIWGKIYEAFQPPLYYVAAAAVSRVSENHRTQVTVLRTFGVATLFGVAGLLFRITRVAFGEEWPPALAFALNVVLLPGLVVRSIHVGNAGFEILGATAFVLLSLEALRRGRAGWFYAAGVVLGATLLTRLTSVSFVPVFAIVLLVAVRRPSLSAGRALIAAALPALMVSPWVGFNLVTYGAPTANSVAKRMQMYLVNPEAHDFGVGEALGRVYTNFFAHQQLVLPQEWPFLVEGTLADVVAAFAAIILVLPLILWPVARARAAVEPWLVALPLVFSTLLYVAVVALEDWIMEARYVYRALPAAFVFAYATLRARAPVGVTTAAAVSFGFLIFVWTRVPLTLVP